MMSKVELVSASENVDLKFVVGSAAADCPLDISSGELARPARPHGGGKNHALQRRERFIRRPPGACNSTAAT